MLKNRDELLRFPQRKKKKQKERNKGPGRPVETAAAEEIGKEACGSFFLVISTSCLDKPSEKHARLIHSSNRPGGD
jgi:hypothetical protein